MPLHPMYPVCTERLHLRPLDEADVAALLSYHSSPDVHRYLPMEPMDGDAVLARLGDGRWSKSTLEEEGDVLVLGADLVSTGELIGDVMLRWLSAKDRCGELGWVFHPEHRGRGYATEAADAVLRLAFDDLDLHRMIARIDPRNTASIQVAERLGMRKEAHLIENNWQRGEWTDEADYAILKKEWRPGGESE
jgi:RimJ/RimL family protein N-acetyltransferase